ncbi:YopX family protein [Clostridium sp. D53t1_180928_C8]|uniref:YopX family protein n=1 Tax=Clostridium sp. D53t1_180928_C8 TaxID=2787101 RepID=UPI0018AA34C9|nr:YopX family protein [Clostridium sp. D53t1_180928_C8]
MTEIKFKIYDKNKKRLISGTRYSITGDGEIQSFNRYEITEGTINNRHLKPILYSGKKDITGRDIYEGFIVKRTAAKLGDEEITGVVILDEYQWWIQNHKEKRAVPLFSEAAVDRIIGNIYKYYEEINI